MNLQWSSPSPCIRTGRVAQKRLDSDDQPPAKCARLSAEAGDTHGLLGASPGSPTSPVSSPIPATHQGPSRIGPFLLLPLADRESVHGAVNTDTSDELLCKVCAIPPLCNFFEWMVFQDIVLLNSPSVFSRLYHQISYSREMHHMLGCDRSVASHISNLHRAVWLFLNQFINEHKDSNPL